MALIQCPECGKEVSDQSDKCLNCGFPLKKTGKPAESTGRKNKTGRSKVVIVLNAGLGFFALLFFIGVISSKGGISGNQNAAIVAWGILAGSILCLFSIKLKSKTLTYLFVIPYAVALVECMGSIKISAAYLILEAVIGVAALMTLMDARKVKLI